VVVVEPWGTHVWVLGWAQEATGGLSFCVFLRVRANPLLPLSALPSAGSQEDLRFVPH
jgi:hypothetical protein